MFAQNIKQVLGTCSVPFSGSGCVAHGTHFSQTEKIRSTDFPGGCARHTMVLDAPGRAVAAEHMALGHTGLSIPQRGRGGLRQV